ncbi:MAG: putative lipid II flippase FtsW [Halanaerobium sp.]|nr:putative lipid II flippase FtsW [Halanaerobium sp.]
MERKKVPDLLLFFSVLILVGFGIVMVYSASSIVANADYGDSLFFLRRQLFSVTLGLIAMFITMHIDYHIYKKLARLALLVAVGGLVIVLIPGVGRIGGGARRWINLAGLPVQPSEITKITIIIYLSFYLTEKKEKLHSFLRGTLPVLLIIGLIFFLILEEPDLGTAVTIAGTMMLMLFAGGIPLKQLITLGLGAIPAVFYFIWSEPYRKERLLAFLNPEKDPLDTGYHIIQSLYALGSGGLFGVGLGQSRQKFFYLPAPSTDFVFAILGEELGYLGTLAVVILFFIFTWRGLKTALSAPDSFGTLLAVGLTCMVTIQAIINIGVVTGSMPVTGITLPFISYGGSSLVIMLVGVGILLNISRQSLARD